ncbi:MAG: hypothetical protein ACOCUI_00510 [bacterium]
MRKDRSADIVRKGSDVYLELKGNEVKLGAGSNDRVIVYKMSKNRIMVLTVNERLRYIGVGIYNRNTLDKINERFFQDVDDLNRTLKSIGMKKDDIMDYTDSYKADYLSQVMSYMH